MNFNQAKSKLKLKLQSEWKFLQNLKKTKLLHFVKIESLNEFTMTDPPSVVSGHEKLVLCVLFCLFVCFLFFIAIG